MAQPAFDPPVGRMPTLQFVPPGELQVDTSYQRAIENRDSQGLIRRIAQKWNWSLCQPLVVSRRLTGDEEELFVIDGQHRLEAARLRGDIAQLPCYIAGYRSAADEAADFVQINKQRRPLTKIEVFRAAIASGEEQACAIVAAMGAAGLSLARHSNYASWKPGWIANVAGIESAWKRHGAGSTKVALAVLGRAWSGQVLQYAGTVFPGIASICADEVRKGGFDQRVAKLITTLGASPQSKWWAEIQRTRLEEGMAFDTASAAVLRKAWRVANGEWVAPAAAVAAVTPTAPASAKIAFVPDAQGDGRAWCSQCDTRVSAGRVKGCKSAWCRFRDVG